MHDEVASSPCVDRVLQPDIGNGVFDERSLQKEIAIAFDVVDRDSAIAKPPESFEHLADGRREELRMRDEVVKEVAVEIERPRTASRSALQPLHDRLLAPVREADVRIADDEDLSAHNSVFRFARGFSEYAASMASIAVAGASRGTCTRTR